MTQRPKIVVGITGASGAPYAQALLQTLSTLHREGTIECAIVLSSTARQVWAIECKTPLESYELPIWSGRDFQAPFASGSARWGSMVIVPCSMGTIGRIAHGISDTLLTRTADVMLKERRRLIVVPRETPLSTIHLENMLILARTGALLLPAMPSFYSTPQSVDDLIGTVVHRILDHLDLPVATAARWGTDLKD